MVVNGGYAQQQGSGWYGNNNYGSNSGYVPPYSHDVSQLSQSGKLNNLPASSGYGTYLPMQCR